MITSKSNEQIKFLVSLKNKKYREKYSKYIIEGIKIIGEMIDSEGINPSESIVYSPEILERLNNGKELLSKIKQVDIEKTEVSAEVFEHISETETPQGVLVVKDIPNLEEKDIFQNLKNDVERSKNILVLDKVSDAGNFGTIIRSAVTFGIDSIICLKGTVDMYNSKVVRSTMGAISKLNIYYVDEEMYKKIVKLLVNGNYEIVGTDLKATTYLRKLDFTKNIVFVMGNEANGMSDVVKAICTELIKIPIMPNQESLNVGVATGICLYEKYINANNKI
ncbi:MAG: RNA methyltransferase [Clostridia bacterium]|nr:RNA methyltransferase [Clostridia bacterium]